MIKLNVVAAAALSDVPEEEEEIVDGIHCVDLDERVIASLLQRREDPNQRNDQPDDVKLSIAFGVNVLAIEDCSQDDVAFDQQEHQDEGHSERFN